MSRLGPLFSWQRLLTSEASDATRTERHVGLQVSLYMSAAGDGAWPGNARLAKETGLGKSTVREALRGLDEKGWLIRSINAGRGNTNTYEARVPRSYYERLPEREKRQILAVFGLDRVADPSAVDEAASGPLTTPQQASREGAADHETRHTLAVFPGAKSASPDTEKRQDPGAKSASGLAPTRPEDQNRTKAAAAAASEELARTVDADTLSAVDEHLERMRAGRSLRLAAHADPARALAWLELAQTEADRNPAGFVLAGLKSGEWPGLRGPTSTSTSATRLQAWVDDTVPQLGREVAHEILDDWDLELPPDELAFWHQAIDERCDRRDRAQLEVA